MTLTSFACSTFRCVRPELTNLVRKAAGAVAGHKFSLPFLLKEWDQTVDAWQLKTWEEYRDTPRLGRKTRLSEPQRRAAWAVFEQVQTGLDNHGLLTQAKVFTNLAAGFNKSTKRPFDFAVIDEAQDLTVSHLRFFAALGGRHPNGLFFAGDLGQRIVSGTPSTS